jgi:prephenate dehydrogenase
LEEFRRELGDLAAALERGDEESIVRWWEAARLNRERWDAGGAG